MESQNSVIRFEAYHGTAVAYKDSILRTKKMKKSMQCDDWAGSGIYYFVDEEEIELIEKCKQWALNIRRYKTAAVVKNTIEIEQEKVLDLTNRTYQNTFQQYREFLYKKANEYAKKNNKKLATEYTNFRKLDCLTINKICEKFGLELVKREAYINFFKVAGDNNDYPWSDIPNVTMVCLRNPEHIKEWSECDVE